MRALNSSHKFLKDNHLVYYNNILNNQNITEPIQHQPYRQMVYNILNIL